jgi:gluconolactonase
MAELREITSGLRFPEGPIAMPDGSVLLVEIAAGCITRVAPDGAKSLVAKTGGGPNGLAIGPDGRCYVCNNGGMPFFEKDGKHYPSLSTPEVPHGWIEAVDLETGKSEVLYRECDGHPLIGPNDIVFDAEGGLWFTDHGHTRRRDRDRGGVYYARPDGSFITTVIAPMDGPNGIGLSPDGSELYVAETHSGRVWAFEIEGPGKIKRTRGPVPWERGRLIGAPAGYHLFDSLAVDSAGNVCVGSLPGAIDIYAPDGSSEQRLEMPDLFPTNICFGGPNLTTAFITLSNTGRLVAMEWPRPGLPLHFLNPRD